MNSSIVSLMCLALLTFLVVICKASRDVVCIPSESETLVKLKDHLIDPSNRLSSWNATANTNCCEWLGVVCSNITAHVVELHLGTSPPSDEYDDVEYDAFLKSMFGGEINPCLVDLKHLNYLDLSGNDFGGMQIPAFLGAITSLTYLNLSHAGFSGKIPPQFGNLTNLVHLGLAYYYPGTVFADNLRWLSGLSNLQYVDLDGANLSKSFDWLQALNALPSLTELHLSDCILHPYDQSSLLNFSSLLTLDLSLISSSVVPKWIFGLRRLVYLRLRLNSFQGPIPDGLQNLTLLETLDLNYNSFSSSLPDWIYSFRHLRFLDLSCNNLCGNISDAMGNLTSLVALDFSHNSIHGALPPSFGKLSSLRHLDLSNNQFNGNPFESLGSLSKLSYLEIGDNRFQGVVKEDDLANLTNLKIFYARGNNFSLKVTPNWSPRFQVTRLTMSSWNLGPKFPSWIQSQKYLKYLEISNTGISDSIPTWFWETFSQDSYLNLSHNSIHGELANTLKNPISAQILDLSSNRLSGQLPQLFEKMIRLDLSNNLFSGSMTELLCKNHDKPKKLEFLNVASNSLSREIPDCWLMWPYLVDVNLQSNHFIGNLPSSMGSLVSLQSLQLRNNTLSGNFPPILKNTRELISLDLGENNFSGNIPAWIGERLVNLKILRLRSNKFMSHIPSQICALKSLQVLDLANNSFSGNIPNCFNLLNAMMLPNRSTDPLIYCSSNTFYSVLSMLLWLKGRGDEYRNILGLVTSIDLSDNKLTGEIPRDITNLDGLNFLNLSHNQLTGHIPQSIGSMRSLQSIDFSRNQLSGQIPTTISNLSFISLLNLSYNHLKGKIPTCTQLQSLEAFSFVGNNLCGEPLPINCSSNGKIPNIDQNGNESDGHEVNWSFVSMALGFMVGFWAVVAPSFMYKSWSSVYFYINYVWFKLNSCYLEFFLLRPSIVRLGYHPNIITFGALMNGPCLSGNVRKEKHCIFSWTQLVMGRWSMDCVKWEIQELQSEKKPEEAVGLLNETVLKSINPDVYVYTYSTLIDRLCKDGKVREVKNVLAVMIRQGVKPNVVIYNTLLGGYCLLGEVKNGNMVRIAVTYTSLTGGFCNTGKINDTPFEAYCCQTLAKTPSL
ncbi:receptor-like protein EIX1 [Abrus precatorius]|uniref:Receptor-like protein EIX1 n=1 Tax=Abrus precatorius TaxID=3816 RepID=A0A8B8LQV8_ABRPR|nr:receptor-like protein EIX1 [Abrus precatorius]